LLIDKTRAGRKKKYSNPDFEDELYTVCTKNPAKVVGLQLH